MIPFLYEASETQFTSGGIGRLTDCLSCVVTEERNGIYECKFTYPISGALYEEIREGRVIACTHDDKTDLQPFDIYARSAPIDGVVTFYAHHVSYRLGNIILKPFTAANIGAAFTQMTSMTYNTNPFTYWTDKSTTGTFSVVVPQNAKEVLGGAEGSILDVYGSGEYEWDKWSVKLHASRGSDTETEINYGVNLRDLVQDVDASGTYTAVVPFWKSFDGELVTLPEGILTSQAARDAGYTDVVPATMDLTSYWDEAPTVAELRAKATAIMESNQPWVPDETVEVDFVALWQTEQYDSVAPLQRLSLCDTAVVSYPALGIKNARMKIVRTEYDVLRERFSRMELGKARTSFASVIKATTEETVKDLPTTSVMNEAMEHLAEAITGASGGYVRLHLDANGNPDELLILDNPDLNQAVNVWRWNSGGLAHSSNGYNAPASDWNVGMTYDGQIVADMITTGILRGLEINNGNGTFLVDSSGNVTANSLSSSSATITGGSINIQTSSDSTDYITLNSSKASTSMQTSGLYVTNKSTAANPNRKSIVNGAAIVINNTSTNTPMITLNATGSTGNVYATGNITANGNLLAVGNVSGAGVFSGVTTGQHTIITQNGLFVYGSGGGTSVMSSISASDGTVHARRYTTLTNGNIATGRTATITISGTTLKFVNGLLVS